MATGAIQTKSTFAGSATPPTGFATNDIGSACVEGSGVCQPPNYSASHGIRDTTIAGLAASRVRVLLTGSVENQMDLELQAQSTTSATTDRVIVRLIPGASVAPAWNLPDLVQFIVSASGTETPKTFTNSPNGTPDHYPSIAGTFLSLRHHRLTNSTAEAQLLDDQLLFRHNDIPRGHETITGHPDTAGYPGVRFYPGTSSDQGIDNFQVGDLVGRWVATSGSDAAAGTRAAPWASMDKAFSDQAEGEIVFVEAGSYTDRLQFTTDRTLPYGTPRTATGWVDGLSLFAVADATVTNTNSICLHMNLPAVKYAQFMGLNLRTTGSSLNPIVKFHGSSGAQSGPYMLIGGTVRYALDQGVQCVGGPTTTYEGGHFYIDVQAKGNGWLDHGTGYVHNFYLGLKDITIENCTADGESDTMGRDTEGQGINIFDGSTGTDHTSNAIVRYCVSKNHLESLNTSEPGWVQSSGDGGYGIMLGRGTDSQAYGNICFNNKKGIITAYQSVDTKLFNNVCYGNTNVGIQFAGVGGNSTSGGLCYHNTLTGNALGVRIGDTGAVSTGVAIENNIIWNNTTDTIEVGTGSSIGSSANNFTTDPKFVDAPGGDYRLDEDTTTADTGGTDLSAGMLWIDARGYSRPQGATASYGAYEVPVPAVNPEVAVDNPATTAATVPLNLNLSIMISGGGACEVLIQCTEPTTTFQGTASGSGTVEEAT